MEALACSRKEGTGCWESGDGAGSLQLALSQGQGQGHLPDPFCPVDTSSKTNPQQSWPCLQSVVSQNPLAKTVGCFTRLLQRALLNYYVERGVKPTGMGAGSHHSGLAPCCSCSPALHQPVVLSRSSSCPRPWQGQFPPSGWCCSGNQKGRK